jgi:hypothetical protein
MVSYYGTSNTIDPLASSVRAFWVYLIALPFAVAVLSWSALSMVVVSLAQALARRAAIQIIVSLVAVGFVLALVVGQLVAPHCPTGRSAEARSVGEIAGALVVIASIRVNRTRRR